MYTNENKNEYSQKIPQNSAEESFQTVLLSERPAEGEEVRRLSALNGSDEDIVISYFPFVIGKHKDLADYVLLKDTVSRFHIRLDENNGRYTVTDLNSTNGTRVRGRCWRQTRQHSWSRETRYLWLTADMFFISCTEQSCMYFLS